MSEKRERTPGLWILGILFILNGIVGIASIALASLDSKSILTHLSDMPTEYPVLYRLFFVLAFGGLLVTGTCMLLLRKVAIAFLVIAAVCYVAMGAIGLPGEMGLAALQNFTTGHQIAETIFMLAFPTAFFALEIAVAIAILNWLRDLSRAGVLY